MTFSSTFKSMCSLGYNYLETAIALNLERCPQLTSNYLSRLSTWSLFRPSTMVLSPISEIICSICFAWMLNVPEDSSWLGQPPRARDNKIDTPRRCSLWWLQSSIFNCLIWYRPLLNGKYSGHFTWINISAFLFAPSKFLILNNGFVLNPWEIYLGRRCYRKRGYVSLSQSWLFFQRSTGLHMDLR